MGVFRCCYFVCDSCGRRSEVFNPEKRMVRGWSLVYRNGEVRETYCPYCREDGSTGGHADGACDE